MNNDSVKMFRSAIGGFHRDDVINYIRETDQKHADETAELNTRLTETEQQCSDLCLQIRKILDENDALKQRISELMVQCTDAQSKIDQKEQEITDVNVHLTEALEQVSKAKAEITDKDAAVTAAEAEKASLSAIIEEKNAQLQRLDDLDRVNAENAELKKANADAEEALRQSAAENAELKQSLAKAETDSAELSEKLQAAEAIIAAQPIEPVYDPNDHTSPAYKLEMYDRISAQLGDILINANRNADDILTAAREEADKLRIDAEIECEQKRSACNAEIEQIRAETLEEAAYIRERLSGNAADMLSTVSADLHGNIENCIREMNDAIADMQYDMQALLSKLTSRSGEMNDRISYYQSCVSEGIEKKLSDMDIKYGIQPDEA